MIPCIVDSALSMLDENACRAWWLRRLHPAGTSCPHCKIAITGVSTETWADDRLIRCRNCGKWFDNKTATPLSGVHANWRQLTLLVTLLSANIKPSLIARLCQLSEDTVRRLSKKILGVASV